LWAQQTGKSEEEPELGMSCGCSRALLQRRALPPFHTEDRLWKMNKEAFYTKGQRIRKISGMQSFHESNAMRKYRAVLTGEVHY
jgi:hypothetical protein